MNFLVSYLTFESVIELRHERIYLRGSIPTSNNPTNSSNLRITTSVLSSVSKSSFPGLVKNTVKHPASLPAAISSTESPTMISGIGLSSAGVEGISAVEITPQVWAMCRIPVGDGFGGRKPRVMIGAKGLMCDGMWVVRR